MPARLTQEKFIKKCKIIHNDCYDYSKVEYKNNKTPICIICKTHGVFLQMAGSHITGKGCRKCARVTTASKTKNTKEYFIQKSIERHGDKFTYDKVVYVNAASKVIITCPIHGDFLQKAGIHMSGCGCKRCHFDGKFKGDEEFKRQSYEKWKGEIIPIEEYKGDHEKMLFKHIKCGHIFTSAPYCHLQGSGCPKCRESRMERVIGAWLYENNIKFDKQKRFDTCRHKYPLPFDFYLQDLKVIIEYDGELHNRPWNKSKTRDIEKCEDVKFRDSIKTKWCQDNDIKLIRISYLEKDRYKEILCRELNIN